MHSQVHHTDSLAKKDRKGGGTGDGKTQGGGQSLGPSNDEFKTAAETALMQC
jgi:hypothetical protein